MCPSTECCGMMREASHGRILTQNYWEPDYINDNNQKADMNRDKNSFLDVAWKAE